LIDDRHSESKRQPFRLANCRRAMELAQYHQWWKHQGGQELRRLLLEHWDPIGVKDAPEAASEYDGYRAGVMQLLRSGASAEEIAEHLSQVEQERMGFRTTREQLRPC
jgi:hypothetical protein